MRVLIIRTDHLGDLILTTPLMRAVTKAGHRVEVLTRRALLPAIESNPHLAAKWCVEDVAPDFPRGWLVLGRWLRDQRFDAIIIPHGRPRELLMASAWSGTRIRITSWAGVWGRLTRHHCIRSKFRHQRDHVSRVILNCGEVIGAPPDGLLPDFFIPEEKREWARSECSRRFAQLTIVGIHPGCSGNTCNLPGAEYGRLARMLVHDGDVGIVATGVDSEQSLLNEWPSEVMASSRFWDTVGKVRLLELAALIEQMTVLVVVGTGPLHVASALRIATVSPFCRFTPISAAVWGNLGGHGVVVEPPDGYCRSVRSRDDQHCNFGGTVTAEHLYQEVRGLLAEKVGK